MCVGFRTPAALICPRAPAAGVRKAPRHEIASGDGAPAVPQAAGCRKRLWGFGLRAICVGYPARTEMQLKRFGTNIAKWGFHVLSHQEFQGLKPATAARATTSARYASLRALADSIKGHDSTALRQSPFAEPKPFRSSRQDNCRSVARGSYQIMMLVVPESSSDAADHHLSNWASRSMFA